MKQQDIYSGQSGFTLIEVLVTLAIIAVLSALTFINLGRPQASATTDDAVQVLVADLAAQRSLAMSGAVDDTGQAQPQGIHLQSAAYTLFSGATLSTGDSNNYTVDVSAHTTLSTSFAGGDVVFDAMSGEVHNFDPAHNTITLTHDDITQTLTINRYGVVTVH